MPAPIIQHLACLRARIGDLLVGLCEREAHLHTQRIFAFAIHAWLLFNTLLLLPYYESLWGPDSLVSRPDFDPSRWEHWFVHLPLHPALADHAWIFVTGQLFFLGLGLTATAPRIAAVGVYVFTMNLYHRTGQMLDGGNNLAELLLFYFMFMNASGRPITGLASRWASLGKLQVACSNAAFYMCRIQIVVVYFCAGLLKLNGPLWQKGMALYYILQGESYTHPMAQEFVVEFPGLAMLATYATMLFQVLFVVLVWWRPARPYLIAMGVSLHLFGIAMGMGLLFFGLVMCLAYVAFLPADVSARIRRPWLDASPLIVDVPAAAPRLGALFRVLRRLDLGDRIIVRLRTDAEVVRAMDATSQRCDAGIGALWAALRRMPLLLPLVPLVCAAWYLGLVQIAYRRWLLPRPA